MDDRILTQHPQGKRGVNISTQKYEIASSAAAASLSIGPGEKLKVTPVGTPGTDWMAAFKELMSGGFDRYSSKEARGVCRYTTGSEIQALSFGVFM